MGENNGCKIKFNIEITDESGNKETHPVNVELESEMSEEEACSIDDLERNLLEINKKAIRKAISEKLKQISKKKQNKNNSPGEE